MFWQGPHLVKYASNQENGYISIFAFPLATVISFCHTVACNFLHLWALTCQVSLCLYKNAVNEIKPSQLKNSLVLVDVKNTIGCLGKKFKMIIKIVLFLVSNNSWKLVLRRAKTFLWTINLHWLCSYNKW